MNKSDLNKIAIALIEKYGTETGVELLAQLIQEMNKPNATQIISDPTPYTPPYTPHYNFDSVKWNRDITLTFGRMRLDRLTRWMT